MKICVQICSEVHALACLNQAISHIQAAQSRKPALWLEMGGAVGYMPVPAAICMRAACLLESLNYVDDQSS